MRRFFQSVLAVAMIVSVVGVSNAQAQRLTLETIDEFAQDGGNGSAALCQYDPANWEGLGGGNPFVPDCISALLYSVRTEQHNYFPAWLTELLGPTYDARGRAAVVAVDSVQNDDPALEEAEAIRQCNALVPDVLASCFRRCN